jgi:hypothetical protein
LASFEKPVNTENKKIAPLRVFPPLRRKMGKLEILNVELVSRLINTESGEFGTEGREIKIKNEELKIKNCSSEDVHLVTTEYGKFGTGLH